MARYSWEAELRRQQREAQRQERAREKLRKAQAKLNAIEQAKADVAEFEELIRSLTGSHKECSEELDWMEVLSSLPPPLPAESGAEVFKAHLEVLTRRPMSDARRGEIVAAALQAEGAITADAVTKHNAAISAMKRHAELGARIVAGRADAYLEALKGEGSFTALEDLACEVAASVIDPNTIECELGVLGTDVVPAQTLSLTASQSLSSKATPKGRVFEIYLDHICSCALRAAREVFAVLPVSVVLVHCSTNYTDPSTGRRSKECILSVAFYRSRFQTLDFEHLDPSDSVDGFPHRADLKAAKRTGVFRPVERMEPDAINPVLVSNGVTVDQLLARVRQLTGEIAELRSEIEPPVTSAPSEPSSPEPQPKSVP